MHFELRLVQKQKARFYVEHFNIIILKYSLHESVPPKKTFRRTSAFQVLEGASEWCGSLPCQRVGIVTVRMKVPAAAMGKMKE
jgi:hypothetical protein